MKHVIATLETIHQHELNLIGKSPTTLFVGNQQDHDRYHIKLAKEYKKAISNLKTYHLLLSALKRFIAFTDKQNLDYESSMIREAKEAIRKATK